MIAKYFNFAALKTNFRTEVLAGLTTFMTMSYIIFVNPSILSQGGMPAAAVMAATCVASAVPTLLMGLWAKYPLALAPGMGLNAFVAFSIIKGKGLSWETAMAMIFIEGVVITILVLTQFRQQVMDAIPMSLKRAIGAGIGLFLAFLGLTQAGFVASDPSTYLTLGKFGNVETSLALVGLIITVVLVVRRVQGALLLGILATTVFSMMTGHSHMPDAIFSWPSFETTGGFVRGLGTALQLSLVPLILTMMLSDFFDTMGTVIAVGEEGGFLDKTGNIPRLNRILIVDSVAAFFGGAMGCSSSTTYIESASGVAAGGRSGFASVVTGLLFLVCLFFSPLAGLVPKEATAPALILVGFFMMSVIMDIEWKKAEEALPAFLTLLMIPLTFNISDGIGWGIISYVLVQIVMGKGKKLSLAVLLIALVFAFSFSPWAGR